MGIFRRVACASFSALSLLLLKNPIRDVASLTCHRTRRPALSRSPPPPPAQPPQRPRLSIPRRVLRCPSRARGPADQSRGRTELVRRTGGRPGCVIQTLTAVSTRCLTFDPDSLHLTHDRRSPARVQPYRPRLPHPPHSPRCSSHPTSLL